MRLYTIISIYNIALCSILEARKKRDEVTACSNVQIEVNHDLSVRALRVRSLHVNNRHSWAVYIEISFELFFLSNFSSSSSFWHTKLINH